MENKEKQILMIINKACEECIFREKCPEEDCYLFRIERILTNEDNNI